MAGGLSGCHFETPQDPHTTTTSADPTGTTTASDDCAYERSGQEMVGGPLQRQANATTYSMNYIAPGKLQDATVIPLVNESPTPVLIDSVDLVDDENASPLRLEEAFVAPPHVVQTIGRVHDNDRYEPAVGHCLPPVGHGAGPILGLRIGPASPAKTGGWPVSRNNSVNVHYRSADGQRYVAVFPFRFQYPNRPDR